MARNEKELTSEEILAIEQINDISNKKTVYKDINWNFVWIDIMSGWDVVWPASSTDNAIARFDLTTGKLIQNSAVTLWDDGTLNNVNSIKLDTTYTGIPVEGEIFWNSTEKNLMLRTWFDSVTTDVWREIHMLVRNNTWSTILNWKVVYINWVSTNPTIALAQANDFSKTAKTLSVTTMDIPNGTDWLVTTIGLVHDLNTSWFTAWDTLYLDSSTSGGIVNTNPTGINHTRIIGRCIVSHATEWIISVEIWPLSSHPSDEFKVTDATDMSKQMTFNVSWITAWTKRTFTVPNQDVSLVWDISTQTLTNKSISLWTNTLTTTLSQLNTAVTDADLANDSTVVHNTWTETIGWVKTFSSNPVVSTWIEIWHSSDTTLTRVSAWVVAIEWVNIVKAWAITTNWVTMSTNKLLGRNTAGTGVVEEITLWTWLSFTWTTLNASWSNTKQHRITIPGEQIADTSNYQGLYFYNDTWTTITISNVAIAVWKAAAWSGAACAINLYKSSWTASDWLNTSAINLFTTAVDLWTWYTSLTNVPNITTVEAWRWVTLRITSSAGATNKDKASDLQVIITYTS